MPTCRWCYDVAVPYCVAVSGITITYLTLLGVIVVKLPGVLPDDLVDNLWHVVVNALMCPLTCLLCYVNVNYCYVFCYVMPVVIVHCDDAVTDCRTLTLYGCLICYTLIWRQLIPWTNCWTLWWWIGDGRQRCSSCCYWVWTVYTW